MILNTCLFTFHQIKNKELFDWSSKTSPLIGDMLRLAKFPLREVGEVGPGANRRSRGTSYWGSKTVVIEEVLTNPKIHSFSLCGSYLPEAPPSMLASYFTGSSTCRRVRARVFLLPWIASSPISVWNPFRAFVRIMNWILARKFTVCGFLRHVIRGRWLIFRPMSKPKYYWRPVFVYRTHLSGHNVLFRLLSCSTVIAWSWIGIPHSIISILLCYFLIAVLVPFAYFYVYSAFNVRTSGDFLNSGILDALAFSVEIFMA